MYRKFLLASVGALALTGSAAFAADLPYRAAPPVYLAPPPIFTWTGLYVGGQVGYAWDRDRIVVRDLPIFGDFDSVSASPQGVIGGAHIGYNLQIAQWVAGLEGTVDGTSLSANVFAPNNRVNVRSRSDFQGSIRLRAGIAFDRVLIYGTGGAAFAGLNNTYTDPTGFATGVPGTTERISRTRAGWTVGGGIAYAVTNNWSVRAEYRYSDFGRYTDHPFTAGVFGELTAQHHLTENQVQAGFSYKFN